MAIKIFTQEQAIKRFPKRGYEKHGPMFVAVGTVEEFQSAVSISLVIDGEQVPIGTIPDFGSSDVIGSGYEIQYPAQKGQPIHIVVQK